MSEDPSDIPPSFDSDPAASDRKAPEPPAPPGRNLGQRIARASWWVCFLAILINFVAGMFRESHAALASNIGGVSLVMVAIGLILAVIALLGVAKWGRDDVVRPALVGLVLSLAMIGLTAKAMIESRRAARERESQAAQAREQFEHQRREAFLASGWLGMQQAGKVLLTLTSIPMENPLFSNMLSDLKTDATIALLGVQNFGEQETVVDSAGAAITLQDGTQQPLLDAVPILKAAEHNREQLMRAYSPPLRIPATAAGSTLLFLPSALDWHAVRGITLTVDAAPHTIRGQYLTKEDKLSLLRVATQPASQPVPQSP